MKNTENELISVIVPVYNVEPYLEKCVASIRQQTYPSLEILLVDDGSSDHSGSLCDRLANEDTRIRVIHQPNGGLSAARNTGIDASAGSYLSFVDSDDYIHPQMMEQLYHALKKEQAQISLCGFCKVNGDGSQLPADPLPSNSDSGRQVCHELYGQQDIFYTICWNKLFARSLFSTLRFPVGKLHEDEFVTYQLLYAASRVTCLSQPYYYYVQHEDSIMGQKCNLRHMDAFEAIRAQMQFWQSHGETTLLVESFRKYRRAVFLYYTQFKTGNLPPKQLDSLFRKEYIQLKQCLPSIMPSFKLRLWYRLFTRWHTLYCRLKRF